MKAPLEMISKKRSAPVSAWYVGAMEELIRVVQDLSYARNLESVAAIVRVAARHLTGADGATFILRDQGQCYYVDEDAIEPLWKGKRFPMESCVSGWVMVNGKPAMIKDIYDDPRVPIEIYRPTFVKSMAMVPIRQKGPIGVIGNYWAIKHIPTEEEIAILQALADTTSVALENIELYGRLEEQVHTLQTQQDCITQQNEKLEIFIRALSHDLKEPVRTVIAFSRLVEESQDPERKRSYLDHVQRAADRMGMLIDSVFQYTQVGHVAEGQAKACSIHEVLGEVRSNLSHVLADHQTSLVYGSLPTVHADYPQMIQVFQNLVANAVCHNESPVMIEIDAKLNGQDWLFSVHNNGASIDPELLGKIFLPFKRMTHKEGHSGLGLAICSKIIGAYGGKIWCESALGQGATFYFTLPKLSEDLQAPAVVQKIANVLVVDDLDSDVELMRLTFQRAKVGCNILVARDGVEACEILKQSIKGDKIDLVLLDINMPKMDGFELLSYIRKNEMLKDTAVTMCTGSLYERDKKRAKELGVVGYLLKPPSMDKLSEIIRDVPTLSIRDDGVSKTLMAV